VFVEPICFSILPFYVSTAFHSLHIHMGYLPSKMIIPASNPGVSAALNFKVSRLLLSPILFAVVMFEIPLSPLRSKA
jgi:heme/copper-type cytochrome/quinol oxidase subunit 3